MDVYNNLNIVECRVNGSSSGSSLPDDNNLNIVECRALKADDKKYIWPE